MASETCSKKTEKKTVVDISCNYCIIPYIKTNKCVSFLILVEINEHLQSFSYQLKSYNDYQEVNTCSSHHSQGKKEDVYWPSTNQVLLYLSWDIRLTYSAQQTSMIKVYLWYGDNVYNAIIFYESTKYRKRRQLALFDVSANKCLFVYYYFICEDDDEPVCLII